MTLLAGVYSRAVDVVIPDQLCQSLESALSRHSSERVDRYRDARFCFVKADVGAFGDPAFEVDESAVSALAGEPLLASAGRISRTRSEDLRELAVAWKHGDREPLRRARGVFAVVHYDRRTASLTIATDKLGIRSLYVAVTEQHVFFASALRTLEQLTDLTRVLDLRAVTEVVAFGFPFADRTPYLSVKLLMPAQIIRFDGKTVHSDEYWRWDTIVQSTLPVEDLARASYSEFTNAITRRLGSDASTSAFLSGGLDSRVIVGALRARGVDVHTFNFALPGGQDHVFAAEYAKLVGSKHVEAPMQVGRPEWSMMMSNALNASASASAAARPRLAWSGDGGSVVLGHVYLKPDMVRLAREGKTDALIETTNQAWGGEVQRRLIRREHIEALAPVSRRGLAEELARAATAEAGRSLHLFLLFNDQRRHLHQHFEDIDLHRVEFQLPFFDSDFVASVVRVPVEECLGHKFYMKWLRYAPESVVSVPWQAYPGHEPCPLPMPADLKYQWGEARLTQIQNTVKQDRLRLAAEMSRSPDFPHGFMSRSFVRLAALVYRLKMRDLEHTLKAAGIYYSYWMKSSRRFDVPAPPSP